MTDVSIAKCDRVLVPLSNERDAAETAAALSELLEESSSAIIAIHVIEKAGGAPDKASVEQGKLAGEDLFDAFLRKLDSRYEDVQTKIRYGRDIATTIVDAAHEEEADSIVFTPRGRKRWRKLLTGDVTHNIVIGTDVPILTLPNQPA